MDSSPFASLPPELRNQIYTLTFISPYAVQLAPGSILHPLTRTCRQLRSETLELFLSLTRFNAHLDDGPSTPLAHWLTAMGSRLCLRLREVKVWDLHMLNGTLHGESATEEMLREGPVGNAAEPGIDPLVTLLSGHARGCVGDRGGGSRGRYFLRPVGRQVFHRGWYLKDVILSLQAMGLGLARFCIEQEVEAVEEEKLKQTSDFALMPVVKPNGANCGDDNESIADVEILSNQFGLSASETESLTQQLELGHREVRPLQDQRSFIMRFDESRRLISLEKDPVPGDDESYLKWI